MKLLRTVRKQIAVIKTLFAITLTFLSFSCDKDDNKPTETVSTLAGSTKGFADGAGAAAQFDTPSGVAVDASGNVYVADDGNHKIRKITPTGVVTTFAGSTEGFADGTGSTAQFNSPKGIAVDASGNVYVTDEGNFKIRKITPAGAVTTLAGSTVGFADGSGTSAQFNLLRGIAVDAAGNVYAADRGNHRIRKISPAGVVTTLAGSSRGSTDGTGVTAKFNELKGIAVDASGNVYAADEFNHKIRKITPAGLVTTLAGSTEGFADGAALESQFDRPSDVAVDASGSIYVADGANHKIRKLRVEGTVTTLAGSVIGFADGTATGAKFDFPTGIAVDASGNLYVADLFNRKIRKIKHN